MLEPGPEAINWPGMGHRLESLTGWGGHPCCRINLALQVVAGMHESEKQNPKVGETDKICALNHDPHEVFLSDIPTPCRQRHRYAQSRAKEAVAKLKAVWDKAIWESLTLPGPVRR